MGGFGSLNGTRANQMNWQIDGVDNNDFWHNIPAVNQGGVSGVAGVVMPIDAIDEFSAQTQSSAEGGRNAGGTVNQVLKSGTNSIHGSAYYYNRNEYFADNTPFFVRVTIRPVTLRTLLSRHRSATKTMDSRLAARSSRTKLLFLPITRSSSSSSAYVGDRDRTFRCLGKSGAGFAQ